VIEADIFGQVAQYSWAVNVPADQSDGVGDVPVVDWELNVGPSTLKEFDP